MAKARKLTGSVLILSALMVGMLGASFAGAANPETVTVNANVGGLLTLAVDTNTVSLTGDPNTTATSSSALTTTVRTNNSTGYTLVVRGGAANFTSVGSSDTIPVGNLGTKASGAGAYTALTTSDQTIASSTSRTSGTGVNQAWDFELDIPWVDEEAYTNTLVYTVSANP